MLLYSLPYATSRSFYADLGFLFANKEVEDSLDCLWFVLCCNPCRFMLFCALPHAMLCSALLCCTVACCVDLCALSSNFVRFAPLAPSLALLFPCSRPMDSFDGTEANEGEHQRPRHRRADPMRGASGQGKGGSLADRLPHEGSVLQGPERVGGRKQSGGGREEGEGIQVEGEFGSFRRHQHLPQGRG